MAVKRSEEQIKQAVKEHYAGAIKHSSGSGCCSSPINIDSNSSHKFAQLSGYTDDELSTVPNSVTSFGCGNPVAFMDVQPGEVVLDLGSGAGLDLILAARKVGERGYVIGLDMTPEMIDTCRKNLKKAGVQNAEVRIGEMEDMPVRDQEVDWIISNCVINLSPNKQKVFAEAYRVLRAGGQMMISDIVTNQLPPEFRNDIKAWVGCIAGAVEEHEYIKLVEQAGFEDVRIAGKMTYSSDGLDALTADSCCCDLSKKTVDPEIVNKLAGKVSSIKLYARKPA